MATDDAVELAPDAETGEDTDTDTHRVEAVREWVRRQGRRVPRPGLPSAQNALYGYTVALLFVAPLLAVLGTAWAASTYVSLSVGVATAGLGGTVYALFLTALIVQYERADLNDEA